MTNKEKRARLKEAGLSVPRSNEDMLALYDETFQPVKAEVVAISTKKEEGEIYTYIGAGHEPPQIINFMGMQAFRRGEPVLVTNPVVLEKIKTNHCFVKGEASAEQLLRNDKEAEERVQLIKDEMVKIQIEADRKNRAG